jgi:hypothetical protein
VGRRQGGVAGQREDAVLGEGVEEIDDRRRFPAYRRHRQQTRRWR